MASGEPFSIAWPPDSRSLRYGLREVALGGVNIVEPLSAVQPGNPNYIIFYIIAADFVSPELRSVLLTPKENILYISVILRRYVNAVPISHVSLK